MTQRSRFETYLDILRVCVHGRVKPTWIEHAANLNYSLLQESLAELEASGLIEKRFASSGLDDLTNSRIARSVYSTTPKGLELLKNLEYTFNHVEIKPESALTLHEKYFSQSKTNCTKCQIPLIRGENWYFSCLVRHDYRCNSCQRIQKQKRRESK